MAQFRRQHSTGHRGRAGSTFTRIFVMILLAGGLVLASIYLVRQDLVGKGSGPLPESDPYRIPESTTDPASRFFLPSDGRGVPVHHRYYSLSYVESFELAEWVAYELRAEQLSGNRVKRTDWYESDPEVKSGSAHFRDYSNSSYTRGHLVPAGDMGFDEKAMVESFYMSNMAPQTAAFNNGLWHELEKGVREWTREKGRLYIITGPVLPKKPVGQTIGKNKVWVPEHFYKIVICPDEEDMQPAAFLLSQRTATSGSLMDFMVTVDSLETLTGLDFFGGLLADETEEKVESRVVPESWF